MFDAVLAAEPATLPAAQPAAEQSPPPAAPPPPLRVRMPTQVPAPAVHLVVVPGQSLNDLMASMASVTVHNHREPEHKVCRRLAAEKKKQAIALVRASGNSANPAVNANAIRMVSEANELEARASALVLQLASGPPNLSSRRIHRPSREGVDYMPLLSEEETSPTATRPPEEAVSGGASVARPVPLSGLSDPTATVTVSRVHHRASCSEGQVLFYS